MSSSSGVVDRRTVHDIDLEVQRVTLDFQRLEWEGGDIEDYCVELADKDPVLYIWLFAEHCPEEAREAMLEHLRDHSGLLVTVH